MHHFEISESHMQCLRPDQVSVLDLSDMVSVVSGFKRDFFTFRFSDLLCELVILVVHTGQSRHYTNIRILAPVYCRLLASRVMVVLAGSLCPQ